MRSRGRSDENARIAISAAKTPFLLGVSFRELKHCEQNDARDDVGRARAPRHDSPFRTSATGVCTVWPSHRGHAPTDAQAPAAPIDCAMLDALPPTIQQC